MPKEITQDDAGKWFYMPLGRLYGFQTEQGAKDFKIASDAVIASFERATPVYITGRVNPVLIKTTEELEKMIKFLYDNAISSQ